MTDYLSEGQEIDVIVLDVDRGRIKLSIKELPAKEVDEPAGDDGADDDEGNTQEAAS